MKRKRPECIHCHSECGSKLHYYDSGRRAVTYNHSTRFKSDYTLPDPYHCHATAKGPFCSQACLVDFQISVAQLIQRLTQ